ncbi:MAG: hypothetical protein AAGD10_05865 [Myxococcota bacterium]
MRALLFIFVNIACVPRVTVVHEQTEREANQILLALARDRVAARKQPASPGRYAVTVPGALRDRALLALERAGLPKARRARTRELFAEAPLVPTPAWERVRRNMGVEGDVASALAVWPGVVEAEVLMGAPPDEAGAAVLVVHRPGHAPDASALRRFVEAKIPRDARLELHLVAQEAPRPLPAHATPTPRLSPRLAQSAGGGSLAALALGAALYLRRRRRRAS